MFKRSYCLLLFAFVSYSAANAQIMLNPSSADYNAPYDTLLARGTKGINSGKIIGARSPALGLMFINRAIEIDKDRYEGYLIKGNAYLDYRQLDEALEAFNTCLEVSPDNPGCLYGIFYTSFLGSTKSNINEVPKTQMTQIYNSALAFLAVAPEKMVQEKANAKMLGYMFKLGIDNNDLFQKYMANDVEEYTDANIQVFKEILPAVQATNNNPVVAGILAKLCEDAFYKKDYVKVKEYANQSIATGDAYSTTYYYLANTLYFQDKNVPEAEKIIELGLKHGPYDRLTNLKLDMLYTEAKKTYAVKDYAKTAALLTKFYATNPDSERATALLAFSNYSLKKYPDALKYLKALKQSAQEPTAKIYYPNLDALIAFASKPAATPPPAVQTPLLEVEKQEEIQTKGLDLYDEKKYQESLDVLNTVIPYFEQTKNNYKLSWLYMQAGFNYHNMENFEKAKEYYNKSVSSGGYAPNAYNNLGLILYVIDKNYDAAEKLIQEGLTKHPDFSALQSRMGRFYAAKGDDAFNAKDYPTAATNYEKAINYYTDAEVYTFLGFSYYFMKENDKCLEALDNAVAVDEKITESYPAINQIFGALR
jgi:tetratricopeptide (TPR) repeat protein